MLQVILTLIFYVWLFAVLLLLWRHAINSGRRQARLQDALIDSNNKSAEAAQKSAEAAHLLATYLERK